MFCRTASRSISLLSKLNGNGSYRSFSAEVVEKNTLNKKDVIDAIAAECSFKKSCVEEMMKSFTGVISKEVLSNGKSVAFKRFGTFKLREFSGRTGRNPSTGEAVEIKGMKSISFNLAKSLRVKDI